MSIKTVLISQPEPTSENSPYSKLVRKYKIKIDYKPFIHVEGLSAKEVRAQKVDFSKFQNIILTSRNAVDHFFRITEEMRFKVPDQTKYFCQSEAVAYYLQKYVVYRKRKIYVGNNNFKDLEPIFIKFNKEKFLVPTSGSLNPDIIKTLDSFEISWGRAQLFNTVVSDLSDLRDVYYDILVFFSPLGIESLFENFPDFKQNKTLIAVYGNTTEEAAKAKNLRIDIKAPTEVSPSMAMAIDKYIKG
jgi:uroporphyrinogen-III synthase